MADMNEPIRGMSWIPSLDVAPTPVGELLWSGTCLYPQKIVRREAGWLTGLLEIILDFSDEMRRQREAASR